MLWHPLFPPGFCRPGHLQLQKRRETIMPHTGDGGTLAPRPDQWMGLIATVLGVVLALAGITAVRWLFNPGTGLLPAVPLFVIWLATGVLIGLVVRIARSGRLLPALLLAATG